MILCIGQRFIVNKGISVLLPIAKWHLPIRQGELSSGTERENSVLLLICLVRRERNAFSLKRMQANRQMHGSNVSSYFLLANVGTRRTENNLPDRMNFLVIKYY